MEKKRSLKYLLVSVCLALLVASIGAVLVGATDTIEVDADLAIHGASLDFNDDVGIAFAIADGVWKDNTVLELYYDKNPGNIPGTPDEVLDSASFVNDAFVRSTEKGDVTYDLVISDGFAPKDMHRTVYARLRYNDVEYGPTYKTGALELVHLLKEQVVADPTLDEYGVRLGLYDSIIAYANAAREKFFNEPYADYHLVRVEDGYILDNANEKWSYGLYADGAEVQLTVSDEVTTKLNTANTYFGDTYSLMGWSASGNTVVGNSTATTIVVNSAGTYAPVFKNNTAIIKDTSSSTTVLTATGDSTTLAPLSWSALEEEITYKTTSSQISKTVSSYGGFTYDAINDAITVSGEGKAAAGSNIAMVHLDNPNYNVSSVLQSTVVEFDLTIPSVDKDGDGIYNEVNGDLHQNITSNASTLFNIMVGYESTGDFIATSASEKLFRLVINTRTGELDGTNTRWSLNSDADCSAGFITQKTNYFNSTGAIFDDVTTYEFDKQYTIKLVYTPDWKTFNNYTDNVDNGTDTTIVGLDRVDIYVDDVLHHSRIAVKTDKKTDKYEDVTLGFGSAYMDIYENKTPDHAARRHWSSARMFLGFATGDKCIADMSVSNIYSYSTAVEAFDGECIDSVGAGVENPYVHANHGIARMVKTKYTVAELPNIQIVDNSSVLTGVYGYTYNSANASSPGSKAYKWNDLAETGQQWSRNAAMKETPVGNYWTYDSATDTVLVHESAGYTSGRITFSSFANPYTQAGIDITNWNGEKLVYEITMVMPDQTNYDNDGANSILHGTLNFGFHTNENVANEAGRVHQFTVVRSHTGGKVTGLGYRVANSPSDLDSPKSRTATLRIIVTPDENGHFLSALVYANGLWVEKTLDGTGANALIGGNATKLAAGNYLFNPNIQGAKVANVIGVAYSNNSSRYATVGFTDMKCYLIK